MFYTANSLFCYIYYSVGLCMKEEVTVADLTMMDTIINQKVLNQY